MTASNEQELLNLEIGWIIGEGKGAVNWQVFCSFELDDIKDYKQLWIPTPATGLDTTTADKRSVLQNIWARRPQQGPLEYIP